MASIIKRKRRSGIYYFVRFVKNGRSTEIGAGRSRAHARYLLSRIEFTELEEKAEQALAPQDVNRIGRVYLIQPLDGGLVKIGFTDGTANGRLAQLQNMSAVPLRLLRSIRGTKSLEAELHKRFAAHRRHGEWFEPAPEILECFRCPEGARRRWPLTTETLEELDSIGADART